MKKVRIFTRLPEILSRHYSKIHVSHFLTAFLILTGCGKNEGFSRGTVNSTTGGGSAVVPKPTIALSARSGWIVIGSGSGAKGSPLELTNIVANNEIELLAWTSDTVSSFSCTGAGSWTQTLTADNKTITIKFTIAPVSPTYFECSATNSGGTGTFDLKLN